MATLQRLGLLEKACDNPRCHGSYLRERRFCPHCGAPNASFTEGKFRLARGISLTGAMAHECSAGHPSLVARVRATAGSSPYCTLCGQRFTS